MDQSEEKPKIIKVLYGIPSGGACSPETLDNLMHQCMQMGAMERDLFHTKASVQIEFHFKPLGRYFVPMAREIFAQAAIDMGADYLFMMDDDMVAPPDLFKRLYAHNVDVVSPLAFTRNPDHKAVMYKIVEGYDPSNHQPFLINHFVENYPVDKLVECDATGFGAVLIKTEVLKAVAKPRFMSTNPTGEDILFCHRARKKGFRVFMDTATPIAHLGRATFIDRTYAEQFNKREKFVAERGEFEFSLNKNVGGQTVKDKIMMGSRVVPDSVIEKATLDVMEHNKKVYLEGVPV